MYFDIIIIKYWFSYIYFKNISNKFIMKVSKNKRNSTDVKLPLIKDRINIINPILSTNKNLKL
jgi:hypothetical protein